MIYYTREYHTQCNYVNSSDCNESNGQCDSNDIYTAFISTMPSSYGEDDANGPLYITTTLHVIYPSRLAILLCYFIPISVWYFSADDAIDYPGNYE